MGEVQGRWSRLGFLAALVLVAFVQLDQFARTLRWHGRLRAQYVRTIEASLNARLTPLAAALSRGDPSSWQAALTLVRDIHPEAEVELFDAQGNRLAALPQPAPVFHDLDSGQEAALRAGRLVTAGPVGGDDPRLLTYIAMRSGSNDVLVRLAVPVPELASQSAERRELMLGHGLALFALAVAAFLALLPARGQPNEAPRALDAYMEAMNRLGEMGRAQSQQHVAERLRLEERIRMAEPMARAGELTSGIVHEVRNALGTIVGYARLIEQAEPRPESREAAARIREECLALEGFVRRFMEFVKAETLTVGPVDVRRLLSRVAARECAARTGADVSLAPGTEFSLAGDEELLERAFENLVRNGREAAGAGGHVILQARREGPEAALTVADDGPGLTLDERERLQPFKTTKAGGLGLGLALAIKIVKLHGGALTMASRTPRGLAVTVHLPLAGPVPSADAPQDILGA